MSISRRLFIKTASVAALVAGTIGKSSLAAFAQDTDDPLSNYTQQTFTQYLDSIFVVCGRPSVEVTLVKVQDTLPRNVERTRGRESFVLHFRGGREQLAQNTYTMEHAALGTFRIFLVPSGSDENGAKGYAATINRVP